MTPLLSAKGGDVTTWRAVENFVSAYRQKLLDRAASDRIDNAETVFLEAGAAVETAIAAHRELLNRLHALIEEVAGESQNTTSKVLKELAVAFYGDLYRHFGLFRSAPAFYQLSMAFLRQAVTTIFARAADQLGQDSHELPEMALIAVGPAGRAEYSPFCPLQILLVHGEAAGSQLQTIDRFCHSLHAGFEAAGLAIDPVITPRTPAWRGTLTEWRQRCGEGLHPHSDDELIDLCRLVDQQTLFTGDGSDRKLKQTIRAALNGNRPAVAHLVNRMASLSNGLGLMGRLKLERSGSNRGLFRLLDHGLLPLTAALSALALLKESAGVSTCDRIHDLLRRGELDVELAERMLATWHCLNDLRLQREHSIQIEGHAGPSSFLDPDELTAEQLQSLKEALESVASIQRHVEIIFSGMGE
jgi:signal-transduction protein with cAMP-binding, CBS, and nucleotidyltransferase domain